MKLHLFCCLTLLSITLCIGCSGDKEQAPPNIILLVADDLRYDAIGANDEKGIAKTPNIDELATKGCNFTNAYVTTSICVTSRASIFTGQYASTHGYTDFSKNMTDSILDMTYPEQLRKNGYFVGFIGKYGVGSKMPIDRFDFWRGFAGQGLYQVKNSKDHLTAHIGHQISDFLTKADSVKTPFCLSVSFKAPHVQEDNNPNTPIFPFDPKYSNLYTKDFERSAKAKETSFDQFPLVFQKNGNKLNEGRVRWKQRFNTEEKYQVSMKGYYRLIAGIDEVVGNLFAELEERNMADNTVIIFISDNGFYLSEYGLAGKWYAHDEAIHVPLIIYDPRTKSSNNDEIALNIDLAPTILDYAGVEIPKNMEGKSLINMMATKKPLRNEFKYEYLMKLNKGLGWYVYIPQSVGLVSKDYKLVNYYKDGDYDNPIYREYYKLDKDPLELNNLVDDDRQLELKGLEEKLNNYVEKIKKTELK